MFTKRCLEVGWYVKTAPVDERTIANTSSWFGVRIPCRRRDIVELAVAVAIDIFCLYVLFSM